MIPIEAPAKIIIVPRYYFIILSTLENTSEVDISSNVKLTKRELNIPNIDPTKLLIIRLTVEVK
jgi:hypothetical protein